MRNGIGKERGVNERSRPSNRENEKWILPYVRMRGLIGKMNAILAIIEIEPYLGR